MTAYEVNFDGLVGPIHNYSGLSLGNVASMGHAGRVASPRTAALEGLAKMKRLADLGLRQAVLPPQERPAVSVLRRLGFAGGDARVIEKAARKAPAVFRACCSASAMWAANAATVSPSADAADRRVHFTPANLAATFHRAIEAAATARALKAIFADEDHFAHHPPLPPGMHFADEGAANHIRLCAGHGAPGVEVFVYGRRAFDQGPRPARFPARQTCEASAAVARLHGLDPARTLFVQQNPEAIDAGVFHNDVIAVGNGPLLLCHERAFADRQGVLAELQDKFAGALQVLEIADDEVTVEEAVSSYLFNSQLVTLPDASMALIAPAECAEMPRVRDCIQRLVGGDNPIAQVLYANLRQSMRNGGGPACLRLRVVLTEAELAKANHAVFLDDDLYARLCDWVERHYRDRLAIDDLADPALLAECRTALDELSAMLRLGSVFAFQRP
ncbi:MAG: N-succinylarginine dihydrolase [Pseudomonadota bacterium]|nr:N-succinylarginine dihydrolase [Pseudomonadota bacterium]